MKRKQRRVFVTRIRRVPQEQTREQWGPLTREEIIKASALAEEAYLSHLRKTGVDTSQFPIVSAPIEDLGITCPQVCLPNEMKPAFLKWMREEYFPSLGLRRKGDNQ